MSFDLTDKQEFFCREYITDFNGTQAAIRAGYSPDSAAAIASENLTKPNIQIRIEELKAERAAMLRITQERILLELSRIAFADPRHVMTWGPDGVELKHSEGLTADQAATVAEASQTISKDGGSIRVKLHDKQKALELLGRHLGIFKDNVKISGDPDAPLASGMNLALLAPETLNELLAISQQLASSPDDGAGEPGDNPT